MEDAPEVFTLETVVRRIQEFRGQRVMLDSDLAVLYGVETKYVARAIKRNPDRFPPDFMFQLSADEWQNLRCQIGTSKSWGGRRYAPYVFTEHGALMLSSVLNSPRATEISILIIRAFVWLRQNVPAYEEIAAKLRELEASVSRHDESIDLIFKALTELIDESANAKPDQGKKRLGYIK